LSLTPLNLIDDAKLGAWPFMRDEFVSPGALLRQLTSLDREVVALFLTQAPERLSAQATDITIVSTTNGTGYALTAAKGYTSFTYVDKDGIPEEIEIAPEGDLPSKHPSGRVVGSTFYPIDPIDREWSATFGTRAFYIGDGDKVRYRYILEPVRVTSMSQTLASPDEAESYLRESLVLGILLASGESVPQERIARAAQLVNQLRKDLNHEMTKRTGVSARFGE